MMKFRQKIWYWDHLQASKEEILLRCQLIENTAKHCKAIPETFFEQQTDKLIQKQLELKPAQKLSKTNFDKKALLKLAIDLDGISSEGLVHGDILARHILYYQNQYWLIDWEPCFWQFRDNEWSFIATAPYIAPSEWGTTKELSSLSDKFAFISSCYKILKKKLFTKEAQLELEEAAKVLSFEKLFHQFIIQLI